MAAYAAAMSEYSPGAPWWSVTLWRGYAPALAAVGEFGERLDTGVDGYHAAAVAATVCDNIVPRGDVLLTQYGPDYAEQAHDVGAQPQTGSCRTGRGERPRIGWPGAYLMLPGADGISAVSGGNGGHWRVACLGG